MKRVVLSLLMLMTLAGPALAAEPPLTVRLLLSNALPYVGEEVILTLEVRHAGRPGGVLALRWPQLPGCVSEELPPLPPRREEGEDGPVVVEAARRLVRPVAAGRLHLAGGVELRGVPIAGAPAALRVRPLPDAGRPEGFAGAVGSAVMELRADGVGTREVAVVLHGNAPLDAFPAPLPALPRGERLVPLGEIFSGAPGGVRERVLRYLYLPGEGRRGELAFSLPLFDPVTESYRVERASLGRPAASRAWPGTAAGAAALLLFTLLRLRQRRRRGSDLELLLSGAAGRPTVGLPRQTILAALRRRGATEASLAELVRYWEAEDRARFAPPPARPPAATGAWCQKVARRLAKEIDKSRCIP